MSKRLTALWMVMNEREFLPKSVASVIDQVEELVIVNNRSTDGTLEWCRELESKHAKVRVIDMDSIFDEKTEAASRNEALSYATGDWIVALDADQILTDGWRDKVERLMDVTAECIGVRYIHNVGDLQHVHKPECGVPDLTWIFFKRTPRLQWRSASEVCAWAGPYHHASADRSVAPGSMRVCMEAAIIHGGFLKRNAMALSCYRAQRGDHGLTDEIKQARIKELQESGNPFLFCGPVCQVDYGPEFLPSCLRENWNDYKLIIDANGQIKDRIVIATGERG